MRELQKASAGNTYGCQPKPGCPGHLRRRRAGEGSDGRCSWLLSRYLPFVREVGPRETSAEQELGQASGSESCQGVT